MAYVRMDDEIKTQASEALAAVGLSVSDAVCIVLKRAVNDQAFPLEPGAANGCDFLCPLWRTDSPDLASAPASRGRED